jgi:hypothetical protein
VFLLAFSLISKASYENIAKKVSRYCIWLYQTCSLSSSMSLLCTMLGVDSATAFSSQVLHDMLEVVPLETGSCNDFLLHLILGFCIEHLKQGQRAVKASPGADSVVS